MKSLKTKKKSPKKPKPKKIELFACGTDFKYGIAHASDLEGNCPLYSSVKLLKSLRTCWEECGIVKLSLTLDKWVEPEDLFGSNK
jgi:hypothetical protein